MQASDELRLTNDDSGPAGTLPSRPRRILAAMRAWAVIAYFHGPKRLDHDWDAQFRRAVRAIADANDFAAYVDALN